MRTRMAFKGILSLLPALPLLVSCDKAATVGPELDPAPAAMDIVAGNTQTAAAGSELANPLVVRVLNSSGQPVANQIVNFRVVQGVRPALEHVAERTWVAHFAANQDPVSAVVAELAKVDG